MIPTLPRRARNRLATAIVAAVSDGAARRALQDLAASAVPPPGWDVGPGAADAHRFVARVRAAARALAGAPLLGPSTPLADRVAVVAALWDAGLGFEAHELLEAAWRASAGPEREALRGLVQVAAGYQHLANGNRAGARTLLAAGSGRLAAARLAGLDLAPFAAAVRASLGGIEAGAAPRFPRAA